jgi:hypothetical protein
MVYVWREFQRLSPPRALFVEAEHIDFTLFRSWRALSLSTYMSRAVGCEQRWVEVCARRPRVRSARLKRSAGAVSCQDSVTRDQSRGPLQSCCRTRNHVYSDHDVPALDLILRVGITFCTCLIFPLALALLANSLSYPS